MRSLEDMVAPATERALRILRRENRTLVVSALLVTTLYSGFCLLRLQEEAVAERFVRAKALLALLPAEQQVDLALGKKVQIDVLFEGKRVVTEYDGAMTSLAVMCPAKNGREIPLTTLNQYRENHIARIRQGACSTVFKAG